VTSLILASSSRYRRELLERLRLPFSCLSPDIDERPLPSETPRATSIRLAANKAAAVAALHPDAVVIGSDQVADHAGKTLGKPETAERAIAQLLAMRGQQVIFYSAVCVQRGAANKAYCTRTEVTFRDFTNAEAERYVALEQPLDCAGAFKCEGLGICLFTSIQSNDPTALIGLPLIELSTVLRDFGLNPLRQST
jgi:septum formation protein